MQNKNHSARFKDICAYSDIFIHIQAYSAVIQTSSISRTLSNTGIFTTLIYSEP